MSPAPLVYPLVYRPLPLIPLVYRPLPLILSQGGDELTAEGGDVGDHAAPEHFRIPGKA